jgi:Fuc2NAc and GlcNAc transferase
MWHPFLALFWVIFLVGTANFYNFMDGIDGISGITGIIGFALLAGYLQMIKEQTMLSTVAITMSLACLGFLPFNLPKARVFMGDIGSILLGSVFGSLVYLASNTWMDLVIMSSFLFPCYADVSTTMLVRWKDRENLTQAHRRHIYQILVNERGNPHWKVSIWFGLVQLIVGFSAILGMSYGNMTVILLLCCYFVIFVMISFYGRYRAIKLTNPNKNQLLQKIMPTITSE